MGESDVRAMILAAGKGERLRPLTERVPKALIPLGGTPLIHYTLGMLRESGVQEVVINLHHLGERIQEYVGDGSRWGLRVVYSVETRLLGTGGGIQKSATHLAGGTFLVINADILVDLDLPDVLRFHRDNHATVTLVLRQDPDVERYGAIEVDGYARVRQILGRVPAPSIRRKKMMFTGVHVLEPSVFSHMPGHKETFSIVDVYVDMLRAGERILGYETKRFWADLGTPERYESVKERMENRDPSVHRFLPWAGGPGALS